MLAKFHEGMTFMEVVAKNSLFLSVDCFFPRLPRMSFPDETWQALKTFTILWHQIFLEFFEVFLDFPIHGGMIRAKTRMGTYRHFFHECKWHWHIGDVFPNILVSYLHFSDLVWISYEVFKVTVKRSKGKSARWQSGSGKTTCFQKLGAIRLRRTQLRV